MHPCTQIPTNKIFLSFYLTNKQELKSIRRSRHTHAHSSPLSHCKCQKPHNSVSCYTHTHITLSLWPVAIDSQALPISDNQPINELCSISQAPAAGSYCCKMCVCGCVCEWQDDGMWVFVSMCYLIGALRAELESHI